MRSPLRRVTSNPAQVRWSEFMRWVDSHSDSRWVYRGLGDASFTLIPGAGRVSNYREARERTLLEVFERRASEFINVDRFSEWDKMALAQHHGLPTRLLDWTTNPLVGAYFAITAEPGLKSYSVGVVTSRARPEASTVPARVVAWAVSSRAVINPNIDRDPFAPAGIRFLLPRALTTRIVTQGGLFSVHPNPPTPWTEPMKDAAHFFDIPGEMRTFFRRKLFYLGIDPQRIMGDLDGLCERLNWQYSAGVGLGAVR